MGGLHVRTAHLRDLASMAMIIFGLSDHQPAQHNFGLGRASALDRDPFAVNSTLPYGERSATAP